MRRVLLGIAMGLMFFAAPAAQKSADDTRPQSNDDLATVLFRQFNRRPEKRKSNLQAGFGFNRQQRRRLEGARIRARRQRRFSEQKSAVRRDGTRASDFAGRRAQYKGGDLPSVAVRDIVIHPRDHDLVIATHGRGIWIVDDISPLRALASDTLSKDIAFLSARPSAQMIQAGGGWANGDAAFVGDNSPNEAVVTYYQKKRHIFGDLQIEVFDAKGESVGTIPASKRRGLNRVRWSMRMPAPRVPTAASIAGGATVGPRLLPGTYTVKMTKDKSVFTTQLQVVTDPRSKHTAADRRAQFDLSMKLYKLLGEMTTTVERINAVRLALNDRAAKAAGDAALQNKLQAASEQVDELRKKFVATREGGAITGEERLREYLANLYGDVNSYEGKPSQTQMERADALGRKLTDVTTSFNTWMAREMSGVNSALKQKNLEEIKNP